MDDFHQPPPAPPAPTNPLGLAGFIVSLVGFVSGGCLAPIGLIISLIALRQEPRGFAIAGAIIGGIASFIGIIVFVLVIIPMIFIGTAAVALSQSEEFQWTTESALLNSAIISYEQNNGTLPASLDDLNLTENRLTDPWGNRYLYTISEDLSTWSISSSGPDGIADTEDDLLLVP